MEIVITLRIEIDESTTKLAASQHKASMEEAILDKIGDGMLTGHDPMLELESYTIE